MQSRIVHIWSNRGPRVSLHVSSQSLHVGSLVPPSLVPRLRQQARLTNCTCSYNMVYFLVFPLSIVLQVFDTSDLPGGVVNIVTGSRDHLTKYLTEHQDVEAVWWVGRGHGRQCGGWAGAIGGSVGGSSNRDSRDLPSHVPDYAKRKEFSNQCPSQ